MVALSALSPEQREIAIEILREKPQLVQRLAMAEQGAYSTFVPRPDRPELFDQQASFCESDDLVSFLIGGNAAGTTSASAYKTAQFVLNKQPPPRPDTPFWIASNTYDQVCDVCWKEKLLGDGHIPPSEVDWSRVRWKSTASGQPLSVPLLPWPDRPGKNWTLEFKSFDQGRTALQAKSIGGFWFSEQFPLDRFLETIRGCRDYFFPGSMFCEFTPIDPELSLWVEQIMDHVPDGWAFYRANTECNRVNLADGWFESFFSAVPDEMRDTRMTGALASFEGVIFAGFSPAMHVFDDKLVPSTMPQGVFHYRGVDWGASTEHPFACVWLYRDGVGDWTVYDEYWSIDQTAITFDHAHEIIERSEYWGYPGEWSEDVAPGGGWQPHLTHPHHCETYADPSRPGEINEFSLRGITTMPASNDVFKGIDCIRSLLKPRANGKPKLRIHARCKHLIQELRKYRWKRGRKPTEGTILNPAVAQPTPLKRDDDTCFIAGTRVQLGNGSLIPIEQVRRGDALRSHRGEATALSEAVATREAEVYRITLDNGRTLTGTALHPLAVDNDEWIPLCESQGKNVDVAKSFGTTRFDGLDIPSPNTRVLADISAGGLPAGPCIFIGTSMPSTTDRSQKAGMFTTLMETLRTTARTIWRYLREALTRSSIFRMVQRYVNQRRHPFRKLVLTAENDSRLLSRLANVSGSAQSDVRTDLSDALVFAFSAMPQYQGQQPTSERHAGENARADCEQRARQRCTPERNEKEHTSESTIASSAGSLSPAEVRKLARRNVRTACVVKVQKLPGTQLVYNLSSSHGTYFAEGVLVSNCDALRYAIYSAERGRGAVPGSMRHREYAAKRRGVQLHVQSGRPITCPAS